MSNAPTPPSRYALLWVGITTGAAATTWVITILAYLLPDVPTTRQIAYTLTALTLTLTATVLIIRYRIQRIRRDTWWDAYSCSAADEPEDPIADIVPLHPVHASSPN